MSPRLNTQILQALRHPIAGPGGQLTKVWARQFQQLDQAFGVINGEGGSLIGLHSERLAELVTDLPAGELWYETDRTVSYIASTDWMYISGIFKATRVNAPTDLGVNDAGFLFYVTDFAHLMKWSGAVWEFIDEGNAYFADFAVAPGTGWVLCDGSASSYLVAGATLTTTVFNTPNLTTGGTGATGVYRKGGAAYSASIITTGGPMTGAGAVDPSHITVLPYFRR